MGPSMADAGFQRLEAAPPEIIGREIIAGHFMGATERLTYQSVDEALTALRRGWSWWKYPEEK